MEASDQKMDACVLLEGIYKNIVSFNLKDMSLCTEGLYT